MHPSANSRAFVYSFVVRTGQMRFMRAHLYAANVRHKVHPDMVRGIFESTVRLSDHSDLMSLFLSSRYPLMLKYGEQDLSLSFLKRLRTSDVKLVEILSSEHWPIYSNLLEMWRCISSLLLSKGREVIE